jgi:acyl-CoA hydrolase
MSHVANAIPEIPAGQLDLTRYLRAGDNVVWSQGTAEPLELSAALVRQRADIGRIGVFIGPSYSETLRPEHADFLSIKSYCGIGSNQRLARAGVLDILPCHYSRLPALVADSSIKCDVAFLHLAAENEAGEFSLGLANDYLLDAARRARVVIAEINDQLPWTHGAGELKEMRIDFLVRTSRPALALPPTVIGDMERRIAAHASSFIGDSAVLEMGIGSIPDAILASLADRKNLGIHSGMLGDSVVSLIESGAIDNVVKPFDHGISIAGLLFGSSRLYRWAHRNPALKLCPAGHTHNGAILSQIDNFIAINSAIEVDLTGQVNAEILGGNYYGAIGGQADFVRGANLSRGGRSIIALPSTAKSDTVSRIVSRLSQGVVTTPHSDADLVVTEWGAAELRGRTLRERAKRMIAIAHPAHREQLEVAAREHIH